jgi:hypothetical protein
MNSKTGMNLRERTKIHKKLRKQEYQRDLTKRWLELYSNMSTKLATYYKQAAVNFYLTERFCSDSKYADKYDNLKDKVRGKSKFIPDREKQRFI